MRTLHGLLGVTALSCALLSGCGEPAEGAVTPQRMADALYAVMAADRSAYARLVVERLVDEEKLVKASEHWKDDKALPLPAQMFRYGAEGAAEASQDFSYSLQSLWPINKQNAPRTEAEKAGLKFVLESPGRNYYGEETLGEQKYFTAVYPDIAVSPACVSCHNDHKDSPRTDFKKGEVMGGVVIRIPM